MNTSIINASPQSLNRGVQDVSGRTPAPTPEDLPTHLPKCYFYAKKGPTTPQLVAGDSRDSIYGADSFDPRKPWANHATIFSNLFSAAGNSQMSQRIVPDDAPPPAAMRLSLDLLRGTVADYVRNADGSFQTDVSGNPIPTGQPGEGYIAKWVLTPIDYNEGVSTFGIAAQDAGDQTDVGLSTQSVRYPILDMEVSSVGAWGNDQGIRLWAATTESGTPLDQRILTNEKVYPYNLAMVARPDSLTTARVVPTLSGSQQVQFTFKKGVINKITDSQLSIDKVVLPAYEDISTPGLSPTFGSFGRLHSYDANIATILGLVYAVEFPVADEFSDFTGATGEEHLFNLVSGTTSTGVPYHTYRVVTAAMNSSRLTETSNLFALGGGDGTMSDQLFADAVAVELAEYANKNSPLMDTAMYPESFLYDSGFPLATKYAMASFVSIRKDTFIVASVYDTAGNVLTDEEERSLAIALKTRFEFYPESVYFGTPAMRAMIVGGSAFPLSSQYDGRLPLSYEIAIKSANYMGSGDGKWRANAQFDAAPLNQIANMRDVSLPFRPADARVKDWDAGLVWAQTYARGRFFFPALQTIYPDDTSVLNNFFTAAACCQLEKVGDQVHREFTGSSGLTQDQLADRIVTEIEKRVKDVFHGRYKIEASVSFTAEDSLRGYSWTTLIKIGSPMMATVQTLIIQSKRIEEMQ